MARILASALCAALLLTSVPGPRSVSADGDDDDGAQMPDPTPYDDLMERGQRALEAGDWPEAARLFGLALREPNANKEVAGAAFRDAIQHVDIYNTRFGELKTKTIATHGMSDATDAIRLGLAWLVAQQQADGRWVNRIRRDYRYDDVSTTALALLALMADGNSEIVGPHQKAVQNGLAWLLKQQKPTGSFSANNYTEGLAALAVVEAFAMGGTDSTYGAAQKSLEYITRTRCPNGGWTYTTRGEENNGDVSVSGMMFQPLKQAQAAWLDFNYDALTEFADWIARITPDSGRVPYRPGTNSHYHDPSMAAIGALVRVYAGHDLADAELANSVKFVMDHRTDQQHHVYFQYYGTMTAFLVGGDTWTDWRATMLPSILAKQHTDDGPLKGRIYDDQDFWVKLGYVEEIVYHCMALLNLECCYRYVPAHRMPTDGTDDDSDEDDQ